MKLALHSLLLVLFSCSLCLAADNSVAGKWDCVSDDGHGPVREWSLVISDIKGELSCSLNDEVSIPLINPTFDGKLLTFTTFINPTCTILFKLNIGGNKLKGDFECPEVKGTVTGTKQG